jgi:biotin carboxyl carrier protein
MLGEQGTDHRGQGDGTPAVPPGEFLSVPERLIVAPTAGRFEPLPPSGDLLEQGACVGTVVHSGQRIPVTATVGGRFMGHLAERGERVRDGQPLAWVRVVG